MVTSAIRIQDLEALRHYVQGVLCQREQLVVGSFPVTERVLVRSGRPCGLYFCLHGPRSVKFTAIWDAQQNTVLFYGSTGERFNKTQLLDPLSPELLSAIAN